MFILKFKKDEYVMFTSFQKNVLLNDSCDCIICEKKIAEAIQNHLKNFKKLPQPNCNFLIKIASRKWFDFSVSSYTFYEPDHCIYFKIEINYMDKGLGAFAPVNKSFYSKIFMAARKVNDYQKINNNTLSEIQIK